MSMEAREPSVACMGRALPRAGPRPGVAADSNFSLGASLIDTDHLGSGAKAGMVLRRLRTYRHRRAH